MTFTKQMITVTLNVIENIGQTQDFINNNDKKNIVETYWNGYKYNFPHYLLDQE